MASSSSATSIQSAKFQGHQGPVLCLDYSSVASLLLSGSEDRTARIWDIRESNRRRALLCIPTQGDVLSVSFAPSSARQPQKTNDDTTTQNDQHNDQGPTTQSIFARDHTIFVTVESSVLEYDLRQATQSILQTPSKDWTPTLQHEDEVNQISLMHHFAKTQQSKGHPKKSKNKKGKTNPQQPPVLYMATCDDAGMIRFVNTTTTSSSQILPHDPEGVAVVPTCAFRPGATHKKNYLELASGGTDCKLHLWDLFKPKRPISSITIQTPEVAAASETSKPQVCNPPMVHTLSWNRTGTMLAAGLGDGNIPIYSLENRKLVQTGFLAEGHDSSVACVTWAQFDHAPTDHNGQTQQQRILCSGGSDSVILLWDVGSNENDALLFDNEQQQTKKQSTAMDLFPDGLLALDQKETTTSQLQRLSLQDSSNNNNNSNILFGIPHGEKLNWITTSGKEQSAATLFAADTSNDITSYTIPLL